MADDCGAPHDTIEGLFCKQPEGNHMVHVARIRRDGVLTGEQVQWDNTDYVETVIASPKKKAQQAAEIIRNAQAEEMHQALDQPHSHLRHDAHPTERIAADLSRVRNSLRRRQVLRVIYQRDPQGINDDGIAAVLNDIHVPAPRVASRTGELHDYGWIEVRVDSEGREMTSLTRAGSPGRLWILTRSGRSLIGQVDFSDL